MTCMASDCPTTDQKLGSHNLFTPSPGQHQQFFRLLFKWIFFPWYIFGGFHLELKMSFEWVMLCIRCGFFYFKPQFKSHEGVRLLTWWRSSARSGASSAPTAFSSTPPRGSFHLQRQVPRVKLWRYSTTTCSHLRNKGCLILCYYLNLTIQAFLPLVSIPTPLRLWEGSVVRNLLLVPDWAK